LGALRDATAAGTGGEATAESGSRVGAAGGAGLLGTAVAALLAVRAGIGGRFEGRTVSGRVGRRALAFLVRLRLPVVNLLAAVFGPLLLVATFVAFVNWGASAPPGAKGGGGAGEVAVWAAAGVVLVVMWRWADLVAWSLHPFYKRRLSSAFALRRVHRPGEEPRAEERPYRTWYRLSQTQPPDFPELLVCAAANISDYGRVPTGSHVTSFVFSAEKVGGPVVGHIPTAELEEAVGPRARDITLPAAVSIAGAAFSPSMGRMTRAPLRFLLALTNMRLGVWVPNPLRVHEFDARRRRRFYPVSPRPHYLVRELFGRNHAGSSFLYVTDGGHYENLGLVELLRRHCMDVWCVDASGDAVDTFDTLAQAMLIAKGELDVDVHLDPTVMAPDASAPRFVRCAHAVGELRYPDGTVGRIVVVKTGVPADAPYEVRAFQDAHPTFPCDPTLNQFFTAERFDAYRALGRFAARTALNDVGPGMQVARVAAAGDTVGLGDGPRADAGAGAPAG
ncbi:MAG: hypothetical protein M3Q48_08875, partial [Actinomycetota bacterium]|nr:hypothetical protein [Actinomycetota bacterium]